MHIITSSCCALCGTHTVIVRILVERVDQPVVVRVARPPLLHPVEHVVPVRVVAVGVHPPARLADVGDAVKVVVLVGRQVDRLLPEVRLLAVREEARHGVR